MTLPVYAPNTTTLSNVPDWQRELAASRHGRFEIKVVTGSTCCGFEERTVVRLTSYEFCKLDKVVQNQILVESKPTHMSSAVIRASSLLWPDDSDEHAAMRTLGAWAVVQFRTNGKTVEGTWFPWPFCSVPRYQVTLTLRKGVQERARESEDRPRGGGGPSGEDPPSWPPRNAMGYVREGHGDDDLHPLGSVDAEDAEIRAHRDDRWCVTDAGSGVIGQTRDPCEKKQIVGVAALPVASIPNVYAKSPDNLNVAYEERLEKKRTLWRATEDDKKLLGKMVKAMISKKRKAIFSADNVLEWWTTAVPTDLKSNKWSTQRFENALLEICRTIYPEFKFTTSVKLENYPANKPPRFTIADGDMGQVLAATSIVCMEALIKKYLREKTVKGEGKRDAMHRIAGVLRASREAYNKTRSAEKKTSIIEGDGSAWDTTCSAELRDCVENPVIEHISNVLKTHMVESEVYVIPHVKANKKLKLNLRYGGKLPVYAEEWTKEIVAIRRSGHRGTSTLNWLTNFVCWHCALMREPQEFLDRNVRYGEDKEGNKRWLTSAFEGDDSILATVPPLSEADPLYLSALQFWERLGFNMKIYIRDGQALFTGYKFALDDNGATGIVVPEIDRCFARSGISCSPVMLQEFKNKSKTGCMGVAKAAALARAHEFAGIAPTISEKFMRYYRSLDVAMKVDNDLRMRTEGTCDGEYTVSNIEAEIAQKNAEARGESLTELERYAATGFGCTPDELETFMSYPWSYDTLRNTQAFCESLPVTWRPPEAATA